MRIVSSSFVLWFNNEDPKWNRLGPTHFLITRYRKERERLLKDEIAGTTVIPDSGHAEFISRIWEVK